MLFGILQEKLLHLKTMTWMGKFKRNALNCMISCELCMLPNPFRPSVAFNIETFHLICIAKQLTGFYRECNTGLKWVKRR